MAMYRAKEEGRNTYEIDQSFIRDLTSDGDDAGIVTAILAMARSLGLGVVAEGVETAEQFAVLDALGCQEYQGFFFSRPLSAEDCTRLLHTQSNAPVANCTRPTGDGISYCALLAITDATAPATMTASTNSAAIFQGL